MSGRRGSMLAMFIFPILLAGVLVAFAAANRPVGENTLIISEVGWGGTAAGSSDEWIELYNTTDNAVDLTGWRIHDGDGGLNIELTGTIQPDSFYLLERTDDNTISDIPADLIYTGAMANDGESLFLRDGAGEPVDTANGNGGGWPAGSGAPLYLSMERWDPALVDTDTNWVNNNQAVQNGLDANGNPINGTPAQPNAAWQFEPTDQVRLSALLFDGYETNDLDEAVQLANTGVVTIDLGGWQLSDGTETGVIPAGLLLPPGGRVWVARDADAFTRQFGFAPQATVIGTWPGFANSGDELLLFDAVGMLIDVLVYEDGNIDLEGWQGESVRRYTAGSNFAAEGQILYRRLDTTNGLIVPDTNHAADWAQMRPDPLTGRKIRYPGWDLHAFFRPVVVTETAVLTLAVAPDNAYQAVLHQINSAQEQLQIASLTFEQVSLAQAVAAAAGRGVSVTVLLEGGPAGGVTDQERYVCAQIEAAGGACYFMVNDPAAAIADRYRFYHAKFMLVDGQRAVISSENLSPRSLPDDEKTDGTWGRRGTLLVTDAPGVVARLQNTFARDLEPAAHQDIFRWQAGHPQYGLPPAGFVPITITGGITYPVRYPAPVGFQAEMTFMVLQSPENSLHPTTGLLGIVNKAGSGDTILIQQLAERPHWGAGGSNATEDPNLRLEAYLAAARRGTRVWLLLDSFFDDGSSPLANAETCRMVNHIAEAEGLDLRCALGNPAGLGLHNKMMLVELNGRGWVHVGSLNGTELSAKGNREVALQVQSDAAYAYLAALFWADWPHVNYLPVALDLRGRAQYPLISEIFYDPAGNDDAEFVELVNPTSQDILLTGWALGDAVDPADFEDVRRFPEQTWLPGRGTLVIALTASGFENAFGALPDYEIVDTHPAVPDMLDDPAWGDPKAIMQLGNEGDEVILRTPVDAVMDAVAYGNGFFPGTVSCALLAAPGHTLERLPYWVDSNQCPADFRDWLFPSPGSLPN